jgi:anti-sigma factor RsiW
MNHEAIQQKLLALFDGPLTEKERKLLEGHLPQCAECRRAVAEWKVVSRKLFPAQAFSEASEDFFVLKVMNRLDSASQEKGFFSRGFALRWLIPLLGSASVAAWVFFTVLPDSTELVAPTNVETAFSSNFSYGTSTNNGITLASYSPTDNYTP